jgi:hypothetical protein
MCCWDPQHFDNATSHGRQISLVFMLSFEIPTARQHHVCESFFVFLVGVPQIISQSCLKSSSLFLIFYFLLCPNCLLFIPLIILLLFLLSLHKKKQELAGWVIVVVPSAPFYFAPQL